MTSSNGQIPFNERRKQNRENYLKSVTIHLDDRTCNGMINNISIGGVYIESSIPFYIGQEIGISYMGSNHIDEIDARGEVVRTDQNGFALKFIDL